MANDNTPNIDPTFTDVGGGSTGAKPASTSGNYTDFSDVQGGSSSTAPVAGQVYVVKAGDSLSKIAKQFYGDGNKWKKIHAANRDAIPNPDLIHPGLTLTIPAA